MYIYIYIHIHLHVGELADDSSDAGEGAAHGAARDAPDSSSVLQCYYYYY